MKVNEQIDNDDAEFDAAFNEEETKPEDESDTGEAAEDEGDGDLNTEEEHDDDVGSDETGDEPGADEQSDAGNESDQGKEDQPGEEYLSDEDKQRQKSWEGRLRKREEELQAREERQKELEGKAPSDESGEDESDKAKVDSFDDPELDGFVADYPDMAGPIAKMVERKVKDIASSMVDEKVNPIAEKQDQALVEAHTRVITEKHPDFGELVENGSITKWVEDQPYKTAVEYQRICESGTAEEVIKMLDRLKDDGRKEQDRDKLRERRKQQKESGRSVPNYPSRVSNKTGNADLEDFDAGFDDD